MMPKTKPTNTAKMNPSSMTALMNPCESPLLFTTGGRGVVTESSLCDIAIHPSCGACTTTVAVKFDWLSR